jgi:hypothetical protein
MSPFSSLCIWVWCTLAWGDSKNNIKSYQLFANLQLQQLFSSCILRVFIANYWHLLPPFDTYCLPLRFVPTIDTSCSPLTLIAIHWHSMPRKDMALSINCFRGWAWTLSVTASSSTTNWVYELTSILPLEQTNLPSWARRLLSAFISLYRVGRYHAVQVDPSLYGRGDTRPFATRGGEKIVCTVNVSTHGPMSSRLVVAVGDKCHHRCCTDWIYRTRTRH